MKRYLKRGIQFRPITKILIDQNSSLKAEVKKKASKINKQRIKTIPNRKKELTQKAPKPTRKSNLRPMDDEEHIKMKDQVMKDLDQDLVMEYKEAFSLFDKDGDGFITNNEFAVVIRSMGINPLEREIQELLDTSNTPGRMDFGSFCVAMKTNKREPDIDEDLLKAFYVFDKNNSGKIKATELRKALTSLGEPLSDEEAHELIENCFPDASGFVNYKDFTKRIFSQNN